MILVSAVPISHKSLVSLLLCKRFINPLSTIFNRHAINTQQRIPAYPFTGKLGTKHNAEINNVSEKCEIIKADLIDGVEGVADIAVANIMAEILVRLAKEIAVQLKKGGMLIMSGIIKARIDLVTTAFEAVGFRSVKVVNKGEWNALVMQNVGL